MVKYIHVNEKILVKTKAYTQTRRHRSCTWVDVGWGIWITLPRLAQKQDGGRRVPVSAVFLTRHLATACVHSNHPTSSSEWLNRLIGDRPLTISKQIMELLSVNGTSTCGFCLLRPSVNQSPSWYFLFYRMSRRHSAHVWVYVVFYGWVFKTTSISDNY